nr:MAG TPA: hypothetical protein [Caudoviricetes sp.]
MYDVCSSVNSTSHYIGRRNDMKLRLTDGLRQRASDLRNR